jgi:hypothetical protein
MTQVANLDYGFANDLDPQLARPGPSVLWNPLFWVTFATAGSAFGDLRFELAGMAFQPYLAVLSLLGFRACTRIHIFRLPLDRMMILLRGPSA